MNGIQNSESPPHWALVPVKGLGDAKQRLDATLGADRRGITLAMLNDVLGALGDSSRVEQTAVVTADPDVASVARGLGAVVVDEIEAVGMNAAVRLGIEHILKLNGSHVVVLPADIPLAAGAELDRLLRELVTACRGELRGVLHCYTGNLEFATKALDHGFFVSFSIVDPSTFEFVAIVTMTLD